MTSEHDIRLPEGPAASPETRDAAIGKALAGFDEKFGTRVQGAQPGLRLMRQTAPTPSRRRTDMRVRQLIAASLVVLVAGSTTWLFVHDRLGLSGSRQMAVQSGAPAVTKTKQQAEQAIASETPAVMPQAPTAGAPGILDQLRRADKTLDSGLAAPPSAPLSNAAKPAEPQPQQQAAEAVAPPPPAAAQPSTPRASGDPKRVTAVPVSPAPQYDAPSARPAPLAKRDERSVQGQLSARPAPPAAYAPGQRERFSAGRLADAPTAYRGGPPAVQGYIAPTSIPPSADQVLPAPAEQAGRDQFAGAGENPFRVVREAPVSTFSIDVDTASYSFVRASLNRNVLPQPAAVRTEELVNYFPYGYEAPASANEPFRVATAVFPSPWSDGRKIIRIGIKGYQLPAVQRPRANLVLLIDTSGSMSPPNRLPLVKQSLTMLLSQLEPTDRVAIVTYAGHAVTALEPTPASEKAKIAAAIERLQAGGGTAGGEGIRQAYALAEQNFDPTGVNRVILATDGDFNIGITDRNELKGF